MTPEEQLPLTPDQASEFDRQDQIARSTTDQNVREATGQDSPAGRRRATGSVASGQALATFESNAAARRASEEELRRERSETSKRGITDLFRSDK